MNEAKHHLMGCVLAHLCIYLLSVFALHSLGVHQTIKTSKYSNVVFSKQRSNQNTDIIKSNQGTTDSGQFLNSQHF